MICNNFLQPHAAQSCSEIDLGAQLSRGPGKRALVDPRNVHSQYFTVFDPVIPASPRFLPVGDAALAVEFGNAIDPAINAAVVALDLRLNAADIPGIIETVPTFRSLLVHYDSAEIGFSELVAELRELLQGPVQAVPAVGRRWTVPVVYDQPYGTDLAEVAAIVKLSPDDVITHHLNTEFQVYMVGFAPGIPVLGTLPEALHISRRQSPRPAVPAGSVAIGGIQATILSMTVPSGWYVLGKTPLRIFEPASADPFLFRPGDRVRMQRIDALTYEQLAGRQAADVLHRMQAAA